jgi:hypothetical protein
MKSSNEQYVSLYDYRGQSSRETGLGQKVYAAAKEKNIHVIYADLPAERQREEFNRVATYPISFLDEYFGKETPTVLVATSPPPSDLVYPPPSDLVYLLGRLEALEKQFAELINKLELNTTIEDDDLPF